MTVHVVAWFGQIIILAQFGRNKTWNLIIEGKHGQFQSLVDSSVYLQFYVKFWYKAKSNKKIPIWSLTGQKSNILPASFSLCAFFFSPSSLLPPYSFCPGGPQAAHRGQEKDKLANQELVHHKVRGHRSVRSMSNESQDWLTSSTFGFIEKKTYLLLTTF